MNKYTIWVKTLNLVFVDATSEEEALNKFKSSLSNPNLPIECGIVEEVKIEEKTET